MQHGEHVRTRSVPGYARRLCDLREAQGIIDVELGVPVAYVRAPLTN